MKSAATMNLNGATCNGATHDGVVINAKFSVDVVAVFVDVVLVFFVVGVSVN